MGEHLQHAYVQGEREGDPTLSRQDAEDICAEPWPDRHEAMTQVAVLRRSGWWVAVCAPPPVRPDGALVLAAVYHPRTQESPGSIAYWR